MTIAVATFGGDDWQALARKRAIPSAQAQGVPVVHHHAGTLHDARNGALDRVETPWIIYLDADDELAPGYVAAMATGTADVRAPSVSYIRRMGTREPGMPRVAGHVHECFAGCLVEGNWIVIGAAVPVELVRTVGGWRDFPWSEDWDLWLRCHLAGASIEALPSAVYRAHVRADSRNRGAPHAARLRAHQAIAQANGLST